MISIFLIITFYYFGGGRAADLCTTSVTESALCHESCPCLSIRYWYERNAVECGKYYDKAAALHKPVVRFDRAVHGKNYIILMIDSDAPGSSPGHAWVHWIAETTAKKLPDGELSKQYLKYMSPIPPSGTHHYPFFLIEKRNKDQKVQAITKRANFGYISFINSIGKVVANNMFRVAV